MSERAASSKPLQASEGRGRSTNAPLSIAEEIIKVGCPALEDASSDGVVQAVDRVPVRPELGWSFYRQIRKARMVDLANNLLQSGMVRSQRA